ncbi:hypothetical protein FA15DRAFT_582663 [Coprinopsis marcescibilis]|uniref:DUF952-domain-containing protein n=1 Tax=Coprinopsis marcescibilis TaxID=230819 RepID=A0A5C3L9I4_COPMA|nr:hypothetical protein FA15DRAFT_582663 [Coprinopsis marcescibilis]
MTEATAQEPRYVYKIVSSSTPPPAPLPELLPVSELDQSSGFVHLSTAKQVPNTLQLFFNQDAEVYLLRLEYSKIHEQTKWEYPEGGQIGAERVFPHLYNGNELGAIEVESVVHCKRGNDAVWSDVLVRLTDRNGRPWLV